MSSSHPMEGMECAAEFTCTCSWAYAHKCSLKQGATWEMRFSSMGTRLQISLPREGVNQCSFKFKVCNFYPTFPEDSLAPSAPSQLKTITRNRHLTIKIKVWEELLTAEISIRIFGFMVLSLEGSYEPF